MFPRRRNDAAPISFPSKNWKRLPTQPKLPRSHVGMAAGPDQRVYIVGGKTSERISVPNVSSYDPRTKQWTELPPLRHARRGCAAIVFDRQLFVFGGCSDQNTFLDTCEVLDLSSSIQWEEIQQRMPMPVGNMGRTRHHDMVYLVGGYGSDGFSRCTWSFNLKTREFRSLPNMAESRWMPAVIYHMDSLVVVGGDNGTGKWLRSVEVLDTPNARWNRSIGDLPRRASEPVNMAFSLREDLIVLTASSILVWNNRKWSTYGLSDDSAFERRLLEWNENKIRSIDQSDRFVLVGGSHIICCHPSKKEIVVELLSFQIAKLPPSQSETSISSQNENMSARSQGNPEVQDQASHRSVPSSIETGTATTVSSLDIATRSELELQRHTSLNIIRRANRDTSVSDTSLVLQAAQAESFLEYYDAAIARNAFPSLIELQRERERRSNHLQSIHSFRERADYLPGLQQIDALIEREQEAQTRLRRDVAEPSRLPENQVSSRRTLLEPTDSSSALRSSISASQASSSRMAENLQYKDQVNDVPIANATPVSQSMISAPNSPAVSIFDGSGGQIVNHQQATSVGSAVSSGTAQQQSREEGASRQYARNGRPQTTSSTPQPQGASQLKRRGIDP